MAPPSSCCRILGTPFSLIFSLRIRKVKAVGFEVILLGIFMQVSIFMPTAIQVILSRPDPFEILFFM